MSKEGLSGADNGLSKEVLLEGFDDIWASLSDLGSSLSEDEWKTATRCPGWSVKDNFSHMLGTERMLLGDDAPEVEVQDAPHLKNDIGRFNEAWIQQRRERSGREVLDEFVEVTKRRRIELADKPAPEYAEESWTPAGMSIYARFMRIRIFDQWLHGQDIREALGRTGDLSGPAVELSLDELSTMLGYIVGKKAAAPRGSVVAFDIVGAAPRQIHVAVNQKATVLDVPHDSPTATLTLSLQAFASIVGGRSDAAEFAESVKLGGDEALAARVLEHLPTTI